MSNVVILGTSLHGIHSLERPKGALPNKIANQLGKCGSPVSSRDMIQTVSQRTDRAD